MNSLNYSYVYIIAIDSLKDLHSNSFWLTLFTIPACAEVGSEIVFRIGVQLELHRLCGRLFCDFELVTTSIAGDDILVCDGETLRLLI